MSFKRNTYAEATFTISHGDEAAALFLAAVGSGGPLTSVPGNKHFQIVGGFGESFGGLPTLRCYRRGPNDTQGVLRFCGYMAPFQEDIEESGTLTLTFRSPFGRLAGDGDNRGRFTGSNVPFAGIDAGQIAKALIDATNTTDGPSGLATTGTIEATKLRDRTYQFANVGDAVSNLTNVLDGFDMFESFLDDQGATLAELNIVVQQGQDVPAARYEYGEDTLKNVVRLSRTTQPPINIARVLGANGLSITAKNVASIERYGPWPVQESASDVTEATTLFDKAQALLRPNPVKTITFVPEFGLDSCPKPWDDFFLGDTIRFFARRDALYEDVSMRVNAITVAIDDNGFETAELPDASASDDADPLHENESDPFTTQSSVDAEVV